MKRFIYLGLGLGLLGWFGWFQQADANLVSYSQEVKPILNKHCISCHGGVKKQGKFSLLFREEAMAVTASGRPSIVPFHPEKSEFIQRLHSTDPEERMPYQKEALSAQEIEVLTQWVKQGAPWEDHWAYVPIKKPALPKALPWYERLLFWKDSFVKTPIDDFVLEEMNRQGLAPSKAAPKRVLLRRLCLDLLGLPPTEQQVKEFDGIDTEAAYAAFVDKLLQDAAFGEKWASSWLDLARYSDSRGYQKDNGRSIWPYRDWVIQAFNQNLSYKQFIIKQLAGDLLPNPQTADYIATGFHRNTMNNDETGTVDEEFRVAAILDRVNTTWDALHGTTFSCVQCHSHPYDPIRQEEYYQFMAFLNNTRDEDTGDEAPFIRQFREPDQARLKAFQQGLSQQSPEQKRFIHQFLTFMEPRFYAHYADSFIEGALNGGVQIGLRHGGSCRLPQLKTKDMKQWVMQYNAKHPRGILQLRAGSLNGPVVMRIKLDSSAKGKLLVLPFKGLDQRQDYYLQAINPSLKNQPEDVFRISWFALWPALNLNPNQSQAFLDLIQTKTDNFPIYLEMPVDYRRKTHEFKRGNWLVHGKEVHPETPKFLHAFKPEWPKNRLGLAQWVVDSSNPLFARVMVNRVWEQLFGLGLVETLEDFGSQGAKPSHPKLLDYLAYTFMHDMDYRPKDLIKSIVLSSTYRQHSAATVAQLEKDPSNKYLARGPRFRLSAEQVRDQALAVAGMLNRKMYGKPIMPYQPEGIWQAVNSSLKWKQDSTDAQFRRAIYIFTRRTGPYPSQFTFDSPSREVCVVRRIRTNTPLQALVLLNDPVFVQIADRMAFQLWKNKALPLEEKIAQCYEKMTLLPLEKANLKTLMRLYERALGSSAHQKLSQDQKELKSLSVVCSAMLNLDEFVSKN